MNPLSIADGQNHPGLRLVTRAGIPTPWAQAAKFILEIKGLDFAIVQEQPEERGAQFAWLGDAGSPFLLNGDESRRDGWVAILELAERLQPAPALVPEDGHQRALMYGLANELCGEMGLGWSLRLQMIDASLSDSPPTGAFPAKVARYLAGKYGYTTERAATGRERVVSILQTLSEALGEKDYFFADMTALDLYWAAFGNMFMLLDEKDFPAMPMARDAWANVGGGPFADAVPDNLRRHHARIYERHLSLPLEL